MRLLPLLALSLSLSFTLLPAPAAGSEPVPAQQGLTHWLAQLRDYAPVVQAGLDALCEVKSAEGVTPELLERIRAVQQGDARMRAASQELLAHHIYPDDFLWQDEVREGLNALRTGRYHAERSRILRAGCYGDLRLYLALTAQEERFTPEQLAAPISEAERAVLQQVEELNRLLAAVRTEGDGEKAGRAILPLVRSISAALPTMNPAALCEAERLRHETDSHIARLTNNYILGSRLIDAFVLEPGSYLADSMMTRRAEFATLALVETPFLNALDYEAPRRQVEAFRAAHAGAMEAFCKANGLTGGDASTPEKALLLPEGLHPAERRALMQRFGREVLGDKCVPYLGMVSRERRDGRATTYVAGNAGHAGDTNYCHDKTLLVPYYFLIP